MAFLDTLSRKSTTPPHAAALAAAVATLTADGDLLDVEKRVISLFRDEFPPLSQIDEATFIRTLDEAINFINTQKAAADVTAFVREIIAPAIIAPADRLAAYRYLFAVAMADLNFDPNEARLVNEIQSQFGLSSTDVTRVQQETLSDFGTLHKALAATVLGLLVVTVDGAADPSEIDDVKSARTLLEPIGNLDDTQFGLVFDLALNIHDRFLLDPANRKAFLDNILLPMLTTKPVRMQAFTYALHIATADGNIAQSEIDILKEILQALQISDADGEAIFNQYMSRVKTIDGKPR